MTGAIAYQDADAALRERVLRWLRASGRHERLGAHNLPLTDGFTIAALAGGEPVGVIAVKWRDLPPPLAGVREAFIEVIDVDPGCRRRGIARQLIARAQQRAADAGAAQIAAWSTDDRAEAIRMWHALGFALCPATHAMFGPTISGYFVAKRLP